MGAMPKAGKIRVQPKAGEIRVQPTAGEIRVQPKAGEIRVGVGGWTFEPWRGSFYPKGLAHAKELAYASSKLTSIEINGTFYRTQTPATFAKWRQEVPDGFVFSVKGPRYVVQKRVLAEAGEALGFFFKSGVTELGDRLGPILWQFAPSKVRRRRFWRLSRHAARRARWLKPAPCGGGAPRLICDGGIHRPAAQAQDTRGVCRARELSQHRRRMRRFHLRAAAERR